jgi:hypothetical protein
MTIIKQLYTPNGFRKQCTHAYVNYGLKPYHDRNSPSFFFSTFSLKSSAFKNHNSIAVVVINSSLKHLKEFLGKRKKKRDNNNENRIIYYISTSRFVSKELDLLNIKYIEFPFFAVDSIKAIPVKKGEHIYFYSTGPWTETYGGEILKKIHQTHFQDTPIISTCALAGIHGEEKKRKMKELEKIGVQHFTTREQVFEAYQKSFISVRLVQFDGLADTVQSLGLMGIKCVWNGGTPSALSFQSNDDVIRHIENEKKTIGEIDIKTAKAVEEFLHPKNYSYVFDTNSYIENINGKTFPIIFIH